VKSELRDATLFELSRAGITPTVEINKHMKIRWKSPCGKNRMVTCSISCSDVRAIHRQRSLVRRLLREDGLLPA
jgi:hypothetical protein